VNSTDRFTKNVEEKAKKELTLLKKHWQTRIMYNNLQLTYK